MYTPNELEEMKWSSIPERMVIFDTETTGLNFSKHRILEIGAIKFNKSDYRTTGEIETFQVFIRQEHPIPPSATQINGITDEMVKDGDSEIEALNKFTDFVGDYALYAYNQQFDMKFLIAAAERSGLDTEISQWTCNDLLGFAKDNLDLPNYRLGTVCDFLKIPNSGQHRAVADCLMSLQLFIKLTQQLTAQDIGRAIAALEDLKEETEALEKKVKSIKIKNSQNSDQILKTVATVLFSTIALIFAVFLYAAFRR